MHALSVSEYGMESALDLLIERLDFEGDLKRPKVKEARKGWKEWGLDVRSWRKRR
jgi:hypothetical protein